jgi:hypothetical protein
MLGAAAMRGIVRVALAGMLSVIMIGRAAATTAAGAWTAPLVPTQQEKIAYLSGALHPGSFRLFQEVTSSANPDVIVLDRTWGRADEALLIAKDIHRRGLNTFLYSTSKCFSLCALLFLSGKTKYVFDGARIAVDAWTIRDGTTSELSAEITAHFAEVGIPADFIARISTLPPSDVLWLTADDRDALGIVTFTPPHAKGKAGVPGNQAVTPDGPRNCGALRARYEADNGASAWVVRSGLTHAFYVPSNKLPGLVFEVLNRSGKAAIVHGPALSSMFLSPDSIPTEITWTPGNDHMPEFFRIMSDDGLTPLLVFHFAACENPP